MPLQREAARVETEIVSASSQKENFLKHFHESFQEIQSV